MSLADNLARVRENIQETTVASGRDPNDVRLVAVTKGVSAATIQQAADLGVEEVGENRVQEAREKWDRINGRIRWHFVGHLQSNKVKYLVDKCVLIHSLDRISLARELSKRMARLERKMDCLVQVNVSGEETKHGLDPSEAAAFIDRVRKLPGIRVVGLMTMPPYHENPEMSRPFFNRLRKLAEEIRGRDWPEVSMRELSMGMSGDYTVAISEGATLVRVGSAIFRGDDS